MDLIKDEQASVEGLPVKLLIICIISSIAVPAVWSAFSNYSRSQSENSVRAEIFSVIAAVKQVYICSNGTSTKTEISLKDVDYLQIGDRVESENSSVIRYKFRSGDGEEKIIISEPTIRITSPENTAITLQDGRYTLLLTHINYDKNKDGTVCKTERYVEIRVL